MQLFKLFVGASALALLAACGSSDGVGGGATVTGGVVKGPVLGSTVCAYAVTGGAKGALVPVTLGAGAAGSISGGCYVTPADGTYNFTLPAGTSGDLLLEATGGTFCTNETPIVAGACPGGGAIVSLGGAVMSSAVAVPASGNATVYTTPLTTAAVGAAGAGLSATTFNAQFNTLAGQIIGPGTSVTPGTAPTSGNQPYLGTAATYLQGGGTLSAVVSSLRQGTTTYTSSGGGAGTSPATVNAALAATYNLRFYASEGSTCPTSGCPYTDQQDVTVTVNADSSLSLPGKVLSNPFFRDYGSGPHLPEVIWFDSATGTEYALTNNQTGHFSEINVGNASTSNAQGIPGFLGQLRVAEVQGTAALAQVAGTYAFGQQYAGTDVAWSSITIGTDGAVSFTGTGPAIGAGSVGTVTSYISCCNSIFMETTADLDGGGAGGGGDNFRFYLAEGGGLKDVEYGTQGTLKGVSLLPVQTLPDASANGATIPTTNAATGMVGSTPMNLTITFFNGNPTSGFNFIAQDPVSGTIQKKWYINVQNPAGIAVNTNYSCIHGSRTKGIEAQPAPGVIKNTAQGGNCNVYITHLVTSGSNITEIKGRFTAEIFSYLRNDRVIVSDGAFSYTAPAP